MGLNPGLLNFDKPFIRSKAPHIRGKMRLLERILGRMVEVSFSFIFSLTYYLSFDSSFGNFWRCGSLDHN